jgi:hypothetical protein
MMMELMAAIVPPLQPRRCLQYCQLENAASARLHAFHLTEGALMIRTLSSAVLAALCAAAHASSPDFASPTSYVQSLPLASIETSANGDLNGDGREDWVISVVTPNGDHDQSRQLVVLLQEASGRYVLSARSRIEGVDPNNGTSTNEFEVEIRNGSFFVSRSNRWHGCGTRDRFQFRFSAQGWMLIGATTYDGNLAGDEGLLIGRDRNLLTGAEILSVSGRADIRKKYPPSSIRLDDYPIEREQIFRIPYKGKGPC